MTLRTPKLWLLPLSAFLTGLTLTGLLVWLVYQANFRLWEQSAVAESERLSAELSYRVTRAREPLVSVAVLYLGSEEVTQDEIVAAYDQLMLATDRQPGLSLGFIQQDQGEYFVAQAAGDVALLPEGPSDQVNPALTPAIEQARAQAPNLDTGPLFRHNGTSYLTMSIAVTNAGEPGVLVSLIDFSDLVDEVMSELLIPGSRVEIIHPAAPDIDHASLPPLPTSPEATHSINIDLGNEPWHLNWFFDADFEGAQDERLMLAVLVGGLLVSALLSFILLTLIRQRQVVQAEVNEKTRELLQAQDLMVEQEKLAALGGLVAGFSHELNTPIGNSLMGTTSLLEQTQRLHHQFEQDELKRSELAHYLSVAIESSHIIHDNLRRSAELINSFKQMSVDQATEHKRQFNLKQMVEGLFTTLQPQIRQGGHTLDLRIDDTISLNSYPGPLGQVLTNLITNSLIHGFRDKTEGLITLLAKPPSSHYIEIRYRDNGEGMAPDIKRKIFEPFFTTRMGQGGSGLGMHLVYSIVRTLLGGTIQVISEPGAGAEFVITLPLNAPDQPPPEHEVEPT